MAKRTKVADGNVADQLTPRQGDDPASFGIITGILERKQKKTEQESEEDTAMKKGTDTVRMILKMQETMNQGMWVALKARKAKEMKLIQDLQRRKWPCYSDFSPGRLVFRLLSQNCAFVLF